MSLLLSSLIGDVARLRVPMGVLSFVSFAAIFVVVVVVVTAPLKAILESIYYTFDSVSIGFATRDPDEQSINLRSVLKITRINELPPHHQRVSARRRDSIIPLEA